MALISFNAKNGISVGATPVALSDNAGNITPASINTSGASTLGSASATSLSVSGSAGFTTIPTTSPAPVDDNTTKIITSAWYVSQISTTSPAMDGSAAIGTSYKWARADHAHPSDTTRLTVANPSATGNLTIAGGTITASIPSWDASQTWNNSGVTFTGVKLNVTNTASSATSLLMDLQIGSTSQFKVGRDGSLTILGKLSIPAASASISGSVNIPSGSGNTPISGDLYNLSGVLTFYNGATKTIAYTDSVISSSTFVGTTSVALNRSSGALSLAGIPSIDGVAADTATLWSAITTGSITIGAGITTGALNIATSGTGATPIGIGHTNAVISMIGNTSVTGTFSATGTTTLNTGLSGIGKFAAGVVGTAVSGTDIKTVNGSSIIGSGDILIPIGLTPTAIKTSAYNAVVNDLIRIDSTAGAFTITLPSAPSDGDKIAVLDVANICATNAVLVAVTGGKNIEGDSSGLSLNLNGSYILLIFNNANARWKIEQTPYIASGYLLPTATKTGAYNAAVNELVRVDSTTGAFTITSPSTPTDGDKFGVLDITKKCGTYAVLVSVTGGKTIEGDGTGISLNVNGTYAVFIYSATTSDWKLTQTPYMSNGDVASNTSSSVDSEVVVFSGTTGKIVKRASGSGLTKLTSGVLGTVVSGTDIKTIGGISILGSGDLGVIGATYGGTGISNNAASTITISGNYNSTFTVSGAYNYTFPPASASVGYLNVPQNSQSTAYTTVLADQGKHLLHPAADTTARTFTIDSNANVAYPVGTAITFVNQNAGGVVTIAITTDTMRLAGAGTTGSRTLAANGVATALKLTSTEWIISGTGLT